MAVLCKASDALAADYISNACVCFGVFDGVHLGHRYVIDQARDEARAKARPCVVLTFDIDPDEMFHADRLKKLMSNERRLKTLAALDVDAVVVFPFTREFASQEPHAFLDSAFAGRVPCSIHVGEDFRFGSRAAGDLGVLSAWGSAHGMDVHGHQLLLENGEPVTSTRIRLLLGEGNVAQAAHYLDGLYTIDAAVQQGRGEGADFGFKTANLHVPDMLRALSDGVYAAYATVDGVRYKAAVSNGVAPTFADTAKANVEVHILDFDGDLYGKTIEVSFVEWLRPMMTFPSVDELISTVMGNIDWVRNNL